MGKGRWDGAGEDGMGRRKMGDQGEEGREGLRKGVKGGEDRWVGRRKGG